MRLPPRPVGALGERVHRCPLDTYTSYVPPPPPLSTARSAFPSFPISYSAQASINLENALFFLHSRPLPDPIVLALCTLPLRDCGLAIALRIHLQIQVVHAPPLTRAPNPTPSSASRPNIRFLCTCLCSAACATGFTSMHRCASMHAFKLHALARSLYLSVSSRLPAKSSRQPRPPHASMCLHVHLKPSRPPPAPAAPPA